MSRARAYASAPRSTNYNKITADLEDILNEGFSENPKDLPILQTVTQLENDDKIQTASILETLARAIQNQNDQIDVLIAQIESLENDDLGVSIVIGAYYNHVLEDIDEGGDDSGGGSDEDGSSGDLDDEDEFYDATDVSDASSRTFGGGLGVRGGGRDGDDNAKSPETEKTGTSSASLPIFVSQIPDITTSTGNSTKKHQIKGTNVEILFGLLYQQGDTEELILQKQISMLDALKFGDQDMESQLETKNKVLEFLANLRDDKNLIESYEWSQEFSEKRRGRWLTRKGDNMFVFYKLRNGSYGMLARQSDGSLRTTLLSQEKAKSAIDGSDYIFNIKIARKQKGPATAFISAPGWLGANNESPSPFPESVPNDIFWQPATYGHNVLAEWEKVSEDKVIPREGPVYAVNGDRYFTLTANQILDTFDNHPVFLLPISPYFETNNNRKFYINTNYYSLARHLGI